MTNEAFTALVSRLEEEARSGPRGYRARVVALGALAYAYVGGVLVGALGLLGAALAAMLATGHGLVVFKLLGKGIWALLALLGAIARALWVRLDAPKGIRLTRRQVPELFSLVQEVRRSLRAPRAHVVLLTGDFNAAVVQHPRLGILGWPRNYLILGLPLLQALSVEQLRAVIAHEFGHLSGAHGRIGGWIYRARSSWSRLLDKMEEEEHWASFIFLPFFRWYAPYFNAYSFVLARQQEYEADQGAVAIAGAAPLAQALVRLNVVGQFLDERYWEHIREQARESPEPDARPFGRMDPRALAVHSTAEAQDWLDTALAASTTLADTHPCLRARLEAIGQTAHLPEPVEQSAGQQLLGPALDTLSAQLDDAWSEQVRDAWRQAYAQSERDRKRLGELEEQPAEHAHDPELLWERAQLTETLRGEQAALPLYRRILDVAPENVQATFAVGRLLLAQDDEAGLTHIEASAHANHQALIPGAQHAVAFLQRNGRTDEAERWIERARAHHAKLLAAQEERSRIRLDGRYDAHGLDPTQAEAVRARLRAYPEIAHAWLIRRRVEHFPEQPLFVVGLERKGAWSERLRPSKREELDLDLQSRLERLPLEGEWFVLCLNHRGPREHQLFQSVSGSQLY